MDYIIQSLTPRSISFDGMDVDMVGRHNDLNGTRTGVTPLIGWRPGFPFLLWGGLFKLFLKYNETLRNGITTEQAKHKGCPHGHSSQVQPRLGTQPEHTDVVNTDLLRKHALYIAG